jgi:hypothetical protein
VQPAHDTQLFHRTAAAQQRQPGRCLRGSIRGRRTEDRARPAGGLPTGRDRFGNRALFGRSAGNRQTAQTFPVAALAVAFAQTRALSPGVCKTVSLAYVGSNPTPATTSENGP